MAQRLLFATLIILVAAVYPASRGFAQVSIDFQAIQSIESGGNPAAFNDRTRCYGLYQISEICLQDYNQVNGTQYLPGDLFNPGVNASIAGWYFERINFMLDHYAVPRSLTTVIACYNWGIGNVVKWYRQGADFAALPWETRAYIRKYLALTAR